MPVFEGGHSYNMNEVVYIHGIPRNEFPDRGKEVGGRPFIDYSVLTDGEFSAALLYEQLGILKAYYPELRAEYEAAQDKLLTSITRGVHLGAVDTATGYGDIMRLANKVLREAKYKNRPAAGKYPGIGEVPAFEPLVGPDCEPILEELRRVRRRLFAGKEKREVEARLEACRQQNRLVAILNQNLEKSGHHILYAYASGSTAANYSAVITKRVLHNNAIGGFHNISKVSQENLRTWIRNGVMRYNAQGGLEPLQPEQTIDLFKNAVVGSQGEGVGVLDPVTVSLIVGLVVAALTATVDLIKALNQQERNQLLTNAQGIATEGFGPEDSDFLSGATQGLPGWLLPIAVGTGAYLLLSK